MARSSRHERGYDENESVSSHEATPSPPSPRAPEVKKRRGIMEDYIYYATPPKRLPYKFPEFPPAPVTDEVSMGGFQPKESDLPGARTEVWRTFPPPDNSAYIFDSHCRLPHLHLHIYPELRKPKQSEEDQLRAGDSTTLTSMDGGRLRLTGANLAALEASQTKLDMTDSGNHGLAAVQRDDEAHTNANDSTIMNELLVEIPTQNHKTKGEIMADTTTFDRLSIGDTPGVVNGDVYSPDQQRADFIIAINRTENGAGQLEFCTVCQKTHIPPGAPITLADRDTCFSQLPSWFPRVLTGRENPWEVFRQIMNRVVALEEGEKKGYIPKRGDALPVWDLHFHEKNPQWQTKHARSWGGWWKCRTSQEAPEAEQNCKHCHRVITPDSDDEDELRPRNPAPPLDVQKQFLQEWMDHHFKMQGLRDKEMALAKLRSEGVPQFLGLPTGEADREYFMGPRTKLLTSATDRIIGPRLLTITSDNPITPEDPIQVIMVAERETNRERAANAHMMQPTR